MPDEVQRSRAVGPARPLPPVAERLRSAAIRVLARGGYSAFTLDAVAREARAYKAAIAYYFGNKAGLVAAVLEALTPNWECDAMVTATEGLPPGWPRVHAHLVGLRRINADLESFRAFYALLPHVLQDEETRAYLADLYGWYRDLDARMFGVDSTDPPVDLQALGSICVACVDGFALQALVDPEGFDLDRSYDALGKVLSVFMHGQPTDASVPDGRDAQASADALHA